MTRPTPIFLDVKHIQSGVADRGFVKGFKGLMNAPVPVSVQSGRGRHTLNPFGRTVVRLHGQGEEGRPFELHFERHRDVLPVDPRPRDAGGLPWREIAEIRGFIHDIFEETPASTFGWDAAWRVMGRGDHHSKMGDYNTHILGNAVFYTGDPTSGSRDMSRSLFTTAEALRRDGVDVPDDLSGPALPVALLEIPGLSAHAMVQNRARVAAMVEDIILENGWT